MSLSLFCNSSRHRLLLFYVLLRLARILLTHSPCLCYDFYEFLIVLTSQSHFTRSVAFPTVCAVIFTRQLLPTNAMHIHTVTVALCLYLCEINYGSLPCQAECKINAWVIQHVPFVSYVSIRLHAEQAQTNKP